MKKLLPFYFIFVLSSFILPIIFGFNIFLVYLLIFNALVIISTLLFYKFSDKVLSLLIINIFLMLLGIINNYLLDPDNFDKVSNQNLATNLETYDIDLKLLIKNSTSTQNLNLQIERLIKNAEELVEKNNKKSYLDMAHIYESAILSGYNKYSDRALKIYREYCIMAPNDAECYAGIARLLILDVKNKSIALPYAMKALELAPDDKSLKVYNELVNYIEKL